LYPLTKDKPKPLLPVAGKPVLEHILERILPLEDVDGIFIVTNAKFYGHFEKWLAEFKEKTRPLKGIEVVNDGTASNEDRLGAMGDLRYVIKSKRIADDLLVVSGDNIFTFDLRGLVERCSESHANVIGLYDVGSLNEAKKFGVVALDGDRVVGFEEKPSEPKSTLTSIGIYAYNRDVAGALEDYFKEGNRPDNPGFFVEWLHKHVPVEGRSFQGKWFDIGSFESLKQADEELSMR
jgi:glucose-1-phosphate thymidylyltransferase